MLSGLLISCGLAPIGFLWIGATIFSKVSPAGEDGADEADDETIDFTPAADIGLTVVLTNRVKVTAMELFSQTPLLPVLLVKDASLLLLKEIKLFKSSLALLPKALETVGNLATTLAGVLVTVLVDKLLVFDRICSMETIAPPLDSSPLGGKQLLFSNRPDGLGFRSERMVRSVKAAAVATADADDEVFIRVLLLPIHMPLELLVGRDGDINVLLPTPTLPLHRNDLAVLACS